MKVKLVGRLTKPKFRPWAINDYITRRNHILILRGCGGLGDLFMHRMIFEDFKLICPDIRITFACPKQFHQTVQDHPFIDELIDVADVDESKFPIRYYTSSICGQTEMANAPMPSPHRSDIWAKHCGVKLTRHNMHFNITEEEKAVARKQLEAIKNKPGPSVCLAPISAISGKNMDESQWSYVIDELQAMDYFVYGLHNMPILNFNAPQTHGKNIRNFMALVAVSDYVITVDSAAFHMGGGLGKPMVGVFGWTDGKVYGKYYQNWELVQRHRDNGNWDCGPCYTWGFCPKSKANRKPCIDSIEGHEIMEAFKKLIKG